MGRERDYFPDFIVLARNSAYEPIQLIVEVTGARLDKIEKLWTVRERWIPAIESVRAIRNWSQWDVIEVAGEEAVADIRNEILGRLQQPPGFGIWRDRGVDGLEYQEAIRSEWDRE